MKIKHKLINESYYVINPWKINVPLSFINNKWSINAHCRWDTNHNPWTHSMIQTRDTLHRICLKSISSIHNRLFRSIDYSVPNCLFFWLLAPQSLGSSLPGVLVALLLKSTLRSLLGSGRPQKPLYLWRLARNVPQLEFRKVIYRRFTSLAS